MQPGCYEKLKCDYISYLSNLPIEQAVDIYLAGIFGYQTLKEEIFADYIIKKDYRFPSKEKLLRLKNTIPDSTWTVAHCLACRGYEFTPSELIVFGNPQIDDGWTVAHEMAKKGHRFTLSDLIELGNPATKRGWTVAHEMASHGFQFKISELVDLGNPQDLDYRTIAHIMVIMGCEFTSDEIFQLIHPKGLKDAKIKNVRLLYQNGTPVFAEGEEFGQVLFLLFGDVGHDNYIPEISCKVVLENNKDASFAQLVINDIDFFEVQYSSLKQKITELVEEINAAIQKQQSLDFIDYLRFWKLKDAAFTALVMSNKNEG